MSNLLQPKEIHKIRLLYKKRFVVIVLRSIMILSVFGIICLFPAYIYAQKAESKLLAEKAIYDEHATGELRQTLISTINNINTELTVFGDKNYNSPIIKSFVDPVLKAYSNNVSLNDIAYTADQNKNIAHIQVFGVAQSREAILNFSDSLKQEDGISNMNVPINNFIKASNMPFNITFDVALK